MERTRSAAVLSFLGALALATLIASPAGAEESEELVPFGRCDVYRPADGEVVTGIDRCVTGMVAAGATVELPEPACPESVPVPATDGVAFYVGECAQPNGGAATAETAPAPTTTTTTAAPPPAPAATPRRQPAPTTTTTVPSTSTTSTTFVVPAPPEPSGGAPTARAGAADVVTDPAESITLTSAGRAATVETDHSPLVMLFALAAIAMVLLGISRMRSEAS